MEPNRDEMHSLLEADAKPADLIPPQEDEATPSEAAAAPSAVAPDTTIAPAPRPAMEGPPPVPRKRAESGGPPPLPSKRGEAEAAPGAPAAATNVIDAPPPGMDHPKEIVACLDEIIGEIVSMDQAVQAMKSKGKRRVSRAHANAKMDRKFRRSSMGAPLPSAPPSGQELIREENGAEAADPTPPASPAPAAPAAPVPAPEPEPVNLDPFGDNARRAELTAMTLPEIAAISALEVASFTAREAAVLSPPQAAALCEDGYIGMSPIAHDAMSPEARLAHAAAVAARAQAAVEAAAALQKVADMRDQEWTPENAGEMTAAQASYISDTRAALFPPGTFHAMTSEARAALHQTSRMVAALHMAKRMVKCAAAGGAKLGVAEGENKYVAQLMSELRTRCTSEGGVILGENDDTRGVAATDLSAESAEGTLSPAAAAAAAAAAEEEEEEEDAPQTKMTTKKKKKTKKKTEAPSPEAESEADEEANEKMTPVSDASEEEQALVRGTVVRALFNHDAEYGDELKLVKGQHYISLEILDGGEWWRGRSMDGSVSGIAPCNVVEELLIVLPREMGPAATTGGVNSARGSPSGDSLVTSGASSPLRPVRAHGIDFTCAGEHVVALSTVAGAATAPFRDQLCHATIVARFSNGDALIVWHDGYGDPEKWPHVQITPASLIETDVKWQQSFVERRGQLGATPVVAEEEEEEEEEEEVCEGGGEQVMDLPPPSATTEPESEPLVVDAVVEEESVAWHAGEVVDLDEILQHREEILSPSAPSAFGNMLACEADDDEKEEEGKDARGDGDALAVDAAAAESGEVIASANETVAVDDTKTVSVTVSAPMPAIEAAPAAGDFCRGDRVDVYWREHNKWYSATMWMHGTVGRDVSAKIAGAIGVADFAALEKSVPALAEWPWSKPEAPLACVVQYDVDDELEFFERVSTREGMSPRKRRKRKGLVRAIRAHQSH